MTDNIIDNPADDQLNDTEPEPEPTPEPTPTIDPADARAPVAAQLMRLHGLIRRFEHRGPIDRVPWGDPRRGQGRVLAILKLKPEISQRELTYLLDMSKQALAELLGKLEKAGLVERTPSPADKRVTMIKLTPAGQAADQLGNARPTDIDQVLCVLDDDELTRFSDYLTRIIDQLEQAVGDFIDERRAMRAEFLRRHDDPRLHLGWDPRPHDDFGPRGRGPRPGPDDRCGPHPDPRFGPGPDPRFGPGFDPCGGPDPRFGPGPGFGPHDDFDPRANCEPRGRHHHGGGHRHHHHHED